MKLEPKNAERGLKLIAIAFPPAVGAAALTAAALVRGFQVRDIFLAGGLAVGLWVCELISMRIFANLQASRRKSGRD